MEVSSATAVCVLSVIVVVLIWAWKLLNRLWLRPKKVERLLRKQGLQGPPYELFVSQKQTLKMIMEYNSRSKPMSLSDDKDVAPRVFNFVYLTLNKYGKNSFLWEGGVPRVIITDPEQIKEIFSKVYDFEKPEFNPLIKLVSTGLSSYGGEKWAKHRKIVNPAFHLEKLKDMLPTFFQCCNDMVSKWDGMLSLEGTCEIDAWPFIRDLTCDVISRTAFGSSYEEGKRIFKLRQEQSGLVMKSGNSSIPGWWLLPLRRMKKSERYLRAVIKGIINKKEKAMQAGEAAKDDLLSILLESNHKEIQECGNNKNAHMTMQDVMDECKQFYAAGHETTAVLLVWTMVLLGRYTDWQARAREEVFQVFGNQKPHFHGLSHLKIVTMILYEVLRLYPPTIYFNRTIRKDVKLGSVLLPAGALISLPILEIHQNHEIWGDDAKQFKPERFSEGVAKATKGQVSFFPFGWGPRTCIGQNFALLEAKMALSLILGNFSFELSSTYAHAPTPLFSLQPKHGAHIILHKL